MKIVIGAAAGNVGRRVAQKVAEANHTAILLGNDLERLQRLQIPGSMCCHVDMSNAEEVIESTQNADALFWLVPPVLNVGSISDWYDDVIAAAVKATNINKIPRVVAISSLGAGSAEGLGTVTYVGRLEKELRKTAANVVFLRPGYFMENFLMQKEDILKSGFFSFPYSPDHDIPFISSDDIGDVAARYLVDTSWSGKWVRHIMGPGNITPAEAAAIFSDELKKEIRYKQVSYETIAQQFAQFGANEKVQEEMVQLYRALGDPNGAYATPRTEEVFTATTLQQVIKNKF